MPYYVGLDVSVKSVSICGVEADGAVIARDEVSSDPDQIAAFYSGTRRMLNALSTRVAFSSI
jgi:transposase